MKIIFAGGGTAGHVNPALAIAGYVKRREPDADIAFSGGKGGIEERLVSREGYPIYTFQLTGLSRSISPKGIAHNLAAGKNTLAAISGAKRIIKEQQPDIVIGMGGYASFPMVYAACKLGVKTAMLEANAAPGLAMRRLASMVDCVMISYEETRKHLKGAKKVVYVGSPVREDVIFPRGGDREKIFQNNNPSVLCFWGSVGAKYMNEKMVDYIELLSKDNDFNLVIATGAGSYKWMPDAVAAKGINLEKSDNIDLREYIYDMGRVMGCSDLVISRAGASALAEICALGKPSIIVPSPYVTDNHQEKNARALEHAGAAVVMLEPSTTGEELYLQTRRLLENPEILGQMGKNALSLARFDALERMYEAIKITLM